MAKGTERYVRVYASRLENGGSITGDSLAFATENLALTHGREVFAEREGEVTTYRLYLSLLGLSEHQLALLKSSGVDRFQDAAALSAHDVELIFGEDEILVLQDELNQ